MIARVADHCFWLGRYLERAENTARVLQVTRNLAFDGGVAADQCWLPVIVVSGEEERYVARFGTPGLEDGEEVQRYLTWDAENPSSLARSVAAARENARSTREVVSRETWEAVNELHLWLAGARARAHYEEDRDGFFRRVRRWAQLALALVQGTMLHDDPYRFIVLGLMLERAGQTARTLDVHHHALAAPATHQVVQTAVFLALLRACSGFEPFMKRSRGPVSPLAVASFLVLDEEFPRSIRFAVTVARRELELLLPAVAPGAGASALGLLRALDAWLVERRALGVEPGSVHQMLTRVVDGASAICDAIGRELLGQDAPAQVTHSQ